MTTTHSRSTNAGKGWSFVTPDNVPIPGDVIRCVQELGIPIAKSTYDELWGHCPGHEKNTGFPDRNPNNWSILTEDRVTDKGKVIPAGTHHCFSCGYGGSFVKLVKDWTNCGWDDAVNWVKARGGILRVEKNLAPKPEKPKLRPVTEEELSAFVRPPLGVLARRYISQDAADRYGVLWEPEKRFFIFPIRHPDTGRLLGWQEKGPGHFKNVPYQVPKSTTLFGYHEFEGDYAVVVESPSDVPRLYSAGVSGPLGTYGVHVSEEQFELITNVTDTIIWALDNDKDGRKLMSTIKKKWSGRGVRNLFYNYGESLSKDPGEQGATEIWRSIRTAYSSPLAPF